MNDNLQDNSPLPAMLLRRSAAFLYDCLLLIALFFIATGIAVYLNEGEAIDHGSVQVLPYAGTLYIIGFAFYAHFWRHGGQTLGMKAWCLRLISRDGNRITVLQCFKRYLAGTLLFGANYLTAVFSRSGLPLADLLSDTVIVKVSN